MIRLFSIGQIVREWVGSIPPRAYQAWKWDFASGTLFGLYNGCIWTFVPKIARENLHASSMEMGWIMSAPALGFLFALLWAQQMEGRSKLPFCYIAWLISRGMFLLIPFVDNHVSYTVFVCLSPFIGSIAAPAYTAVMKDVYPDTLRGRMMSYVRVAVSISTLFSSFIAGRLMDAWVDWHVIFLIGGVFGTLTAYTFMHMPVVSSLGDDGGASSPKEFILDTVRILRRNPGFRWFTASVFIYGFGNLMASTLYPLFQVDHLHVTNTQVANLQNITSFMTMLGYVFWGWYMDKKGPLAAVLLSISIICLQPLCYIFAQNINWLYLGAMAAGIAMSGTDVGYLNTILLFSEPGKEAQYQSIHSSAFGIRGSLAPHFAIPILEFGGFRKAFTIFLGVMLGGVGLQLVSMRDYLKSKSSEIE